MNDRTLLELAAKAAGFQEYEYCETSGGESALYVRSPDIGFWMPFSDDGDALRLAVKLSIEFVFDDESQRVNAGVWRATSAPNDIWDCLTPYNDDKYAAARLAITRAAAAIAQQESQS